MNALYITANCIGLAAALLLCLWWLQRYGTAALAVQPVVLLALYFGMIHFFMPIYKLASGNYRYPADYAPITMLYNALISLLVFGLLVLLLRNPGWHYDPARFRRPQAGATMAYLCGIVLTCIGLFAMFRVGQAIDAIGYDSFRSDRILISSQIGVYTRIDTIILPGVALLLAGLLNRRGRGLLGWVLLAGATAYATRHFAMIQSRNSMILMFVLLAAVYFFYRHRPLRFSVSGAWTWLAVLALLAGLGWLGYNTTVARYAGVDHWYAQAALENLIFTILDGPFGNDENLLWLLEHGHPHFLGQTYLAGITNLVPRMFWPDKPWGAGPELRNLIYPGSYVLGAEGNSSITTGFMTEARMNFGLAGILLVGLLWAWLVRRLVRALLRAPTVFEQAILILLLCFLATAFLYSEFLGLFSRLGLCLIAAWAVRLTIGLVMPLVPARRSYTDA